MVEVDEEILEKTGADLFKELLRVYSVAEVEDYYKAPHWKNDMMRIDLQLMYQHRREAGSPPPTQLENVVMPELPKTVLALSTTRLSASSPAKMGPVPPAGPPVFVPGSRTVVVNPTSSMMVRAVGSPTTTASADSLVNALIAKWKMNPEKTRFALARLEPAERRNVVFNYKPLPGEGESTTLQRTIAKYAMPNAFQARLVQTMAKRAAVGAVGAPAVAGVKRPLITGVVPPAKRLATIGAATAVRVPVRAPGPSVLLPVKRPLGPVPPKCVPPHYARLAAILRR